MDTVPVEQREDIKGEEEEEESKDIFSENTSRVQELNDQDEPVQKQEQSDDSQQRQQQQKQEENQKENYQKDVEKQQQQEQQHDDKKEPSQQIEEKPSESSTAQSTQPSSSSGVGYGGEQQKQEEQPKNNQQKVREQQQTLHHQQHEFERVAIQDWTIDNTKQWIHFKKSIGSQRDRECNTEQYENRNGISLLEVAKSKHAFKSLAGDSKYDKTFSSLLYYDLKSRIEHFSKQKLKKDIVNRGTIIRILKKKYVFKNDLFFGTGFRVGRNLILTSAHLLTGLKDGTHIEVGIGEKWYRASILESSENQQVSALNDSGSGGSSNSQMVMSPMIDCALLQVKDLEDKYHVDTYPISFKGYELLKDVLCCSFPYTRLPLVSPSDHKLFSTVKPPHPSLYHGQISYFDEDSLEISLSGDPGVCKGGLIFNQDNGELCAIIRKQPQQTYNPSVQTNNVLYCTKNTSINAWVNTALKKLQQPPLWE